MLTWVTVDADANLAKLNEIIIKVPALRAGRPNEFTRKLETILIDKMLKLANQCCLILNTLGNPHSDVENVVVSVAPRVSEALDKATRAWAPLPELEEAHQRLSQTYTKSQSMAQIKALTAILSGAGAPELLPDDRWSTVEHAINSTKSVLVHCPSR